MLEFLSYTWIEKESGFQSCERVLGFPIGVGNDCCYVVGHGYYCVIWDGCCYEAGMTIVMWLQKTGVVWSGMAELIA